MSVNDGWIFKKYRHWPVFGGSAATDQMVIKYEFLQNTPKMGDLRPR
jgi:hypothetical protein